MDFGNAIVSGLPLVLIVIGLVEWVKQLGVQGNAIRVVSMVIGAIFGVAYQYSVAPPVDFSGWFAACIYGLGLGLVASGIYDAAADVIKKVVK
jgi:hypothetical protein